MTCGCGADSGGPVPTDERLREVRITGDGRCMFRALVSLRTMPLSAAVVLFQAAVLRAHTLWQALGLAANKNIILGPRETEEAGADLSKAAGWLRVAL
jgi:hypothetical protein